MWESSGTRAGSISASGRHHLVHKERRCSAWPRPDTRSRDTFMGNVMRRAAVAEAVHLHRRGDLRVCRVILPLYRPITRRIDALPPRDWIRVMQLSFRRDNPRMPSTVYTARSYSRIWDFLSQRATRPTAEYDAGPWCITASPPLGSHPSLPLQQSEKRGKGIPRVGVSADPLSAITHPSVSYPYRW